MINKAPRWFDQLNRYRIAAFVLVVPAVLNILVIDLELFDMSMWARRAIYWVGLLILLGAVAIDAREVYRGKRTVKQMIRSRKHRTQTSNRI